MPRIVKLPEFKLSGLFPARHWYICALALALVGCLVWQQFRAAQGVIAGVNLTARYTGGATFYAAPKHLSVGQSISREEVVAHLKNINFTESQDSGQPGSYALEGPDKLRVAPRLPEFSAVAATFNKGRLAALEVAGIAAAEATLEPEPLGAFIASIKDEEASKMFVRRYPVQFDELRDTHLLRALLASEDETFYQHNGNRFSRILANLLLRRAGGGSSLTAQVVKNVVSLDQSRSLRRKWDEVFLAAALEQKMAREYGRAGGKEKLLELYANDVYLGGGNGWPNVYGFAAAADAYFGKQNLRALTLNEAAILVAMLPQPNVYVRAAQKGNYAKLTSQRDRALNRVGQVWPETYSPELLQTTRSEPVSLAAKPPQEAALDTLSRQFIEFAREQQPLVELENLPPAAYSGLHVYTSLDPDLQRAAQAILSRLRPALSRRFPPATPDGCAGRPDRLLGAIVALNPQNGEIIAFAGSGAGPDGAQFASLALNAKDAPASAIKPFWVGLALTQAQLPDRQPFTASSVINGKGASLDGWSPRQGLAGAGRVRRLLAQSADDFALATLDLAGVEPGRALWQDIAGGPVTAPPGQLALGFGAGTEISPLRLAWAYSAFANQGAAHSPQPISRVYLDGAEQRLRPRAAKPLLDPRAAYITAQMLRSVVGYGPDGAYGTARAALPGVGINPADYELAGKTGSGPHSVWMASVAPQLVVTVWLGYQCRSPLQRAGELYAADTAAPVWAEFLAAVRKNRPDLLAGRLSRPDGVVEANRECQSEPGRLTEFYITGTEPVPCAAR